MMDWIDRWIERIFFGDMTYEVAGREDLLADTMRRHVDPVLLPEETP